MGTMLAGITTSVAGLCHRASAMALAAGTGPMASAYTAGWPRRCTGNRAGSAEVAGWQTDDFGEYALYAAVAYIRAAASQKTGQISP